MTSTYNIQQGDCLEFMRGLADCSVDCVVTDPPYLYLDHKLGELPTSLKARGFPLQRQLLDSIKAYISSMGVIASS